jgi:acetylglutamate kinase
MDKIEVLLEALPYIKKFSGCTFVVKYGGAAMEEERLKKEFARDVVLLKYVGVNPVIVHGGGPQIERMLTRLNIPTRFVEGLRATNGETLEIVEMVLSGSINKAIVQAIHNAGGQAIGLSGKDGKLIVAERVSDKDIGFVVNVVGVNGTILKDISDSGYIPVIAPLAAGVDGTTYNVNADTAAGSVAKALMAEKLVLLTDVPGVLDANLKPISSMSTQEARKLVKSDTVRGGMIPKITCCLDALHGGVKKTHIIDGRIPHALLLEVFTDLGIGTQIAGE